MSPITIRCLATFVLIYFSKAGLAQFDEVDRFSIEDGLPSNHLYECVEDNDGFLWIATDAGVARFDGKYFQKFTTEQGLPDNDVIQVVKEKCGRIWINCFNNKIAYFDKVMNRFISEAEDESLIRLRGSGISLLSELKEGGIMYCYAQKISLLYNFKYLVNLSEDKEFNVNFLIQCYPDGSKLYIGNANNCMSIQHYIGSRMQEKRSIQSRYEGTYFKMDRQRGQVYYFSLNDNKIIVLSKISTFPIKFQENTIKLQGSLKYLSYKSEYLSVINDKDIIEFYDKNNFQFLFSIKGDFKPIGCYIDKHDNIWIYTLDKGLILYRRRLIDRVKLPVEYQHSSFLSVTKLANGALFAGNYSGEVLEIQNGKMDVHAIYQNNYYGSWIRNTILSHHKNFTFSDRGIFLNYSKQLSCNSIGSKKSYLPTSKMAIQLNDSIIISCGLQGLIRLNTSSDELMSLETNRIRITTLASIDKKDIIYLGSNVGLYKYSLKAKALLSWTPGNNLLNDRIVSMCVTTDSLLWVATASHGVLVLKNDSVIATFSKQNGLLTNHILTISVGELNQIWIGTNEGVVQMKYTNDNRFAIRNVQNFSVKDGLASNIVNQFSFMKDSMYAATNNGLSVIPSSLTVPGFNIPLVLIAVEINQKLAPLKNHYHLKSNENVISLQIAGIELSGHFKHFTYSLDMGNTWSKMQGSVLNLKLNSGTHQVWLRASDVNGNAGTKLLKIQFDIATPYYMEWWFWMIVMAVIIFIVLFYYSRFTKRKHDRAVDELLHLQRLSEFEIQALKAQINPHFIFNCLNSIKGFIYEEDFERANQYLNNFSKLLRRTLEFSREIFIPLNVELDYIRTYLLLEKQRFENRFDYIIHIDDGIDQMGIQIPSMLLQPFVENAISHGIMNLRDKHGKLVINVYIVRGNLEVSIDDNGVGRKYAEQLTNEHHKQHKGKGLLITERQLELHHIEFSFIDKVNEAGEALGTTVVLRIPYSPKSTL